MKSIMTAAVLLMSGAMFAASVSAEQFVYPAKGQSADKQKKDEAECQTWAVKQSGYDPAKPQTAPAPAPAPAQASGPSGARLRGAAAGAAVGAITDNDKSDAALAGAVGAASAERGATRKAGKQQQQAAQQQQAGARRSSPVGAAETLPGRAVFSRQGAAGPPGQMARVAMESIRHQPRTALSPQAVRVATGLAARRATIRQAAMAQI